MRVRVCGRVADDQVGLINGTSRELTIMRICAFATKGSGSNEELRLKRLLADSKAHFLPYDKSQKLRSLWRLLRALRAARPELVVMEGTGMAGGLACWYARFVLGARYVVSSGDAVGPFIASHVPWAGPAGAIYERLLCRWAAGFIGWTPYLVGRAMTFGCRRAMTAPGWMQTPMTHEQRRTARRDVRAALGIDESALVFGLLGALSWNRTKHYSYGLELVRAIRRVSRRDVVVLVVGGGSAAARLKQEAGELLGTRVLLPGPVPLAQVPRYLAAMDVASLPQSTDKVGSFRYTTKIAEYLDSGLPIVTGQVPMAYDLDAGWAWRLPGDSPWSETYIEALAQLMDTVTTNQIADRARHAVTAGDVFDVEAQAHRVTQFVADLAGRNGEPASESTGAHGCQAPPQIADEPATRAR